MCAGAGVGVGVGGLVVFVVFALLLRWIGRMRRYTKAEHGALTEQLMLAEREREVFEQEGVQVVEVFLT